MFDWKTLVSPSYWFTIHWNPIGTSTVRFMVLVFAIVIAMGIALLIIANRKKDAVLASHLRRLSGPFFFGGILGEIFTFFLYQQVPVLSARFWFLIVFVVFIAWFVVGVRLLIVRVPIIKAADEKRQQFEQYLPKRRKK